MPKLNPYYSQIIELRGINAGQEVFRVGLCVLVNADASRLFYIEVVIRLLDSVERTAAIEFGKTDTVS